MHRSSFSLRRLAASFTLGLAVLCAHAQDAAGGKLVVMTSYPDSMVMLYKNAFEKTYPGMQVDFVRRRSAEALADLEKPGQQGVDVYWAAAQGNFLALARDGAFHHLDIPMAGLPTDVGGVPISDPAFYYAAFELAGYGFVINPARLHSKGLPEPKDWTDLTDPKWQDEIILPQPSKVGFAPMMIDVILQSYGWERGWCILHAIGANAQLLGEHGMHVADEIGKGQASVGLSIDFLARTAIAKGAPLRFAYPQVNGYSPAQVAIMRDAPHEQNAEAFVTFLLSPAGQKLLFDPAVSRLPVRPSVYAAAPAGYFDPFTAPVPIPFAFNVSRALEREKLDDALFDALITDTQLELRQTLDLVAKAERAAAASSDRALQDKAHKARVLACAMPFNEVQAAGVADGFSDDANAQRNADMIERWKKQAKENRSNAESLAEQVLAATRH